MSFPRYPTYKDSGVEWLGEVPSHWIGPKKFGEISSLKGRLGWQGLKADEYREEGPLVVSSAHFSDFKIRWDECPHVSRERYELDANIQLSAKDILLMKDGAALGKLAFVDELPDPACLNSHLLLFRPLYDGKASTYIPKFAFYYMQTPLFQEFMQTRGTGATFMGVSQETISRHLVYWPHQDEQRTIALFLDRETAKIDALAAEQERLITLLKEKRQAVISHAVTKGLDPSVPMKDSGVEWLGDVPAHWQVCTLRRLIKRIEQGWSPECEAQPADENSWGVLKAGCVNRGVFNPEENKTLPDSLDPLPEYEVREGDILMSRASGSPELVGSTALVYQTRPRLMLSDKIFRIHLEAGQNRSFFVWSMNAKHMREQIEQALSGGNGLANNLPQSVLSSFVCAVPPEAEQLAISCALDQESAQIDRLTAEAVLSIELLRERRAALVSAAVTGQIDVRQLA